MGVGGTAGIEDAGVDEGWERKGRVTKGLGDGWASRHGKE